MSISASESESKAICTCGALFKNWPAIVSQNILQSIIQMHVCVYGRRGTCARWPDCAAVHTFQTSAANAAVYSALSDKFLPPDIHLPFPDTLVYSAADCPWSLDTYLPRVLERCPVPGLTD